MDDTWAKGGVRDVDDELLVGVAGEPAVDAELAGACRRALRAEGLVPDGAVKIGVKAGQATLSGEVRRPYQRTAAERAVRTVEGILGLTNSVAVTDDPVPSDVAHQIHKALRRQAVVDGSPLQVTNEGHTVSLDGTVRSWKSASSCREGRLCRTRRERGRGPAVGRHRSERMTVHKPDGLLEYDVREMLSSDRLLDDGRVLVKVRAGLVSLSGAVGSFEESARAAQDTWSVPGVTGVDDRLWVGPVAGAIEDRMVRASCLRALDRESHVPTGSVSVSVEDGLVTLLGTAHHRFQAAAAKRAVATVDGVKGVVDNIIIVSDPIPGDVAARIEGALRHKGIRLGAHIEVSGQDRTVFLDGRVGSWAALREAEDVAWNAPGVSHVVDRLVVAPHGDA